MKYFFNSRDSVKACMADSSLKEIYMCEWVKVAPPGIGA